MPEPPQFRAMVMPWKSYGDADRDAAFAWVDERASRLFDGLRYYSESEDADGRFDRAHARNKAIRQVMAERDAGKFTLEGDAVVIADADTIVPQAQLDAGYRLLAAQPRSWVILYDKDRYYNLAEKTTRRLLGLPPDLPLSEPFHPYDYEHRITAWAGALLVPIEAWQTVGGYDTRFQGWGGEDNAFQLALDTLWGPHQRVPGFALHLWHPRGDADFTQRDWPHNQALLLRYKRANRRPAQMRRLVAR